MHISRQLRIGCCNLRDAEERSLNLAGVNRRLPQLTSTSAEPSAMTPKYRSSGKDFSFSAILKQEVTMAVPFLDPVSADEAALGLFYALSKAWEKYNSKGATP